MTLHLVDKFIDNGTVHPSGCVVIDRTTVLDNHNAFALVSLIILVVRTTSPRSIKRVARIVSANASSQIVSEPDSDKRKSKYYTRMIKKRSIFNSYCTNSIFLFRTRNYFSLLIEVD